ncbi:PREDICTED: interferon-related developmental regulator 1-like [Habropoda laboriosa]|nr:PREDICTED: interferon-related developmental regulator 1-like [Habropoda laboriosa]
MTKYSIFIAVVFLLCGFLGHTRSQGDVPNTEEVLNKVSQVVDLNSLNITKGINMNDLNSTVTSTFEEAKKSFTQKCEKNGGKYEDVANASEKFKNCLESFVQISELTEEMEKYKPTGDLDLVFKNYCRKTPMLKTCVSNYTAVIETCLEPKERENVKIVQNITDSLLDFMCYKEGDRIALFISADGPECLKSKQDELAECFNNTFLSYIPQQSPNGSLPKELPPFIFGTKECTDITTFQTCGVRELEKCSDPTPANIADSVFNYILKVTPCQNLIGDKSAASNLTVSLLVTMSIMFSLWRFVIIPTCKLMITEEIFFLAGHGGKRAELTSDEDSINNDACSVSSNQSDNRSMLDDVNDNEVDEIAQQEAFEEKLKEAIDGLTQKSAKGRTICFNGIEKIFAVKYVPEFVEDRKMTITDSVERGLKKGRTEEQSTAARLSTLLCVQLGAFESAEVVCRDLKSILTFIASDTTASTQTRSECCWALSMNQFLSGNDATDTIEIVQLLSGIFSGSYLKGNGAIATISPEVAALHAAAISSWTLLLTVMASADVYNLLASDRTNSYMPSLNRLRELLQSPHLDVRLSAGEALAVIFELGRDFSCDYEQDWSLDLIEALKELATDSNKYRAKKDRKQQRANFRDILRYIEEDIVPEMHVKFGQEILYLEGWCARTQYNACCRLLGPGINIHLAENQLLREIFHLGNKVLPIPLNQKTSKLERTLMNAAAFKARTIQRNKNRDKRSAALAP